MRNKPMTDRLAENEDMPMSEILKGLWTVTNRILIENVLGKCTIFDKIEFSGITKKSMLAKVHDLETRQVPQRDVLLHMKDEDVAEYWFKNWLHPALKHAVGRMPPENSLAAQVNMLHFYENGQQNFAYSLQDIKNYCISGGADER